MTISILSTDEFVDLMNKDNLWDNFTEFERLNENIEFFPENIRFYVLKDDSYLYGASAIASSYRGNSDEWHIWEFQINRDFTRKGYGRQLFNQIMDTLSGEISLCTLDTNAYCFWKKMLKERFDITLEKCIIKGINPEENRFLIRFNTLNTFPEVL